MNHSIHKHNTQKLNAQLVYQQFLLERILARQILNAPDPQQALDETRARIRSLNQIRTMAPEDDPAECDAKKMLADITERFCERLKSQVNTHQSHPVI